MTVSVEYYVRKIKPFFDAQFNRLDRMVMNGVDGYQSSNVKTFIEEAIFLLLDSIKSREEQERILKSFLIREGEDGINQYEMEQQQIQLEEQKSLLQSADSKMTASLAT